MADTVVTCKPNGPYRVNGPFKLVDPKGNEVLIEEGRTISLCRCGGSANKPYCDGTHGVAGFSADEPFKPKV